MTIQPFSRDFTQAIPAEFKRTELEKVRIDVRIGLERLLRRMS